MVKVRCPRCLGTGQIVKRVRNIPEWCQQRFHKLEMQTNKVCCSCGLRGIYFQKGDGRVIHSLCERCYIKLEAKKETKK